MYRVANLERAKQLSVEKGLKYGFCVFDGKMYVGTAEELDRIGVIIDKSA